MRSSSGTGDVIGVEELLAEARGQIVRLHPAQALAASRNGSIMVDIRPSEQRDRDGLVPGGFVIARNVLEWRLDPRGEHRDPNVARPDRQVILICDEGYQSSLAAASLRRFGLDAADVIGGVQAWRDDGLPLLLGGPDGNQQPEGRQVHPDQLTSDPGAFGSRRPN